jgi:hypothetical protein
MKPDDLRRDTGTFLQRLFPDATGHALNAKAFEKSLRAMIKQG